MDDILEEKDIGNSRKRHGKGKHEKGMDDISEEKENENSRKRHGKGGVYELGMDNISEDKQSSGMAPMSETCKETPRTSSPHGRVLEIWHEACYPDFFFPTSINF